MNLLSQVNCIAAGKVAIVTKGDGAPARGSSAAVRTFSLIGLSASEKSCRASGYDGSYAAGSRESRHGWLYAFGQRSLVEILEGSRTRTRHGGGSFE